MRALWSLAVGIFAARWLVDAELDNTYEDVQEGAGAMAAALSMSRAQVRRSLRDITGIMSKISLRTRSEQIAVDSLLKQTDDIDKLNPETVQTLENISTLFTDILYDMIAARDEDQLELDHINVQLEACNVNGNVTDYNLEVEKNASEDTHFNCRDTEEVRFDDNTLECGTFTEFLSQLSSPQCQKPSALQSEISAWDTFLAQGDLWFQTTLVNYVPKRDTCVTTTELLTAQRTQCHQDQVSFENKFCMWLMHRQSMCSDNEICYNNTIATYEEIVEDILVISNQRVREAGMIIHMECLLRNLINGITDPSQCPFPLLPDLQEYNVTIPDLIPMKPCDPDPYGTYPGHADWYLWAYGDLSTKTPAETNTGVVC